MVCLDQSVEESKKWMKFSDFIKDVQAIQQKQKDLENDPEGAKLSDKDKKRLCDYETFIQLLDLFTEMCLGRNEEVQNFVGNFFELKVILSIIENYSYPDKLRMRMIKLLENLYLDVEKFKKIEVPSETAILDDIPDL